MFNQPSEYIHTTEPLAHIEALGEFISSPAQHFPAVLNHLFTEGLTADVTALNSNILKSQFEHSKIAPKHRFVGSVNGVLLTSPALALSNDFNHLRMKWFTSALLNLTHVVLTRQRLPGRAG